MASSSPVDGAGYHPAASLAEARHGTAAAAHLRVESAPFPATAAALAAAAAPSLHVVLLHCSPVAAAAAAAQVKVDHPGPHPAVVGWGPGYAGAGCVTLVPVKQQWVCEGGAV